jgi:hypothetical protein
MALQPYRYAHLKEELERQCAVMLTQGIIRPSSSAFSAPVLHSVFHIGLLKPYHGTTPTGPGVLPPTRHGRAIPQLAKVIKGRLARGVHELLVRGIGQAAADATWVELGTFKRDFPPSNSRMSWFSREGEM